MHCIGPTPLNAHWAARQLRSTATPQAAPQPAAEHRTGNRRLAPPGTGLPPPSPSTLPCIRIQHPPIPRLSRVGAVHSPALGLERVHACEPARSVSQPLFGSPGQSGSQPESAWPCQPVIGQRLCGRGRADHGTEWKAHLSLACLVSSGLVWSGMVWAGLAWPGLSCLASASPCACACARSLPSASDMLCGAAPTRLSGRRTDSRVGGRQSTVRL